MTGVLLERAQHRRVVQVRAEDPLQRWMDLGEKPPDAVAGRG